ncbi:hypothetical protein ACYULU_12135 [Breznakiellaceae bacterium SP9]
MKKKLFLVGMLAAVLACGMTIIGCDKLKELLGGDTESYPVVSPINYTATYTVGSGSGTAPEKKTVAEGTVINLPGDEGMTAPPDTIFDGWKDGGGTAYKPGKSYTVNTNVTFTAQWKPVTIAVESTPRGNPLHYLANQEVKSGDYQLKGAFYDTKTGYVKALYKIGSIENQLITNYSFFYYDGFGGYKIYTLSEIEELEVFRAITSSIKTTNTLNVGVEAGIDIGISFLEVFELNLAKAVINASYQSSIITFDSYASYERLKTTRAFKEVTKFLLEGRPTGYYRFGAFATVDYYAEVLINPVSKEIVGRNVYYGIKDPDNIWTGLVYSETPTPAIPDAKKLDVDRINVDEILNATNTPTVVSNLDIWGGKASYSYRVYSSGTISYTLTGGGAGGAGAAAARDVWALLKIQPPTRADAGWSADGGPTVLKLNGTEIARADGGTKVNGPDSGDVDDREWYRNGVKGEDGKTKTGTQTVLAGDKITIEVGYGGGGSGGAAANDTGGNTSSGSANKTLGSEGSYSKKSGTSANASRGGVGAMHSLIFPSSGYTSDLQKGSSSPAAGNATAASGGQTKGQGGAAGDEYATGGMYASGGGGGAAGGFILIGSGVKVGEIL